jgi:Flp pilus assembly CpaF family ATPase
MWILENITRGQCAEVDSHACLSFGNSKKADILVEDDDRNTLCGQITFCKIFAFIIRPHEVIPALMSEDFKMGHESFSVTSKIPLEEFLLSNIDHDVQTEIFRSDLFKESLLAVQMSEAQTAAPQEDLAERDLRILSAATAELNTRFWKSANPTNADALQSFAWYAWAIWAQMCRYGVLTSLLSDPTISEVMLNEPSKIYFERHGRLNSTSLRFESSHEAMIILERIISTSGRRIDESVPYCDTRLPDGSRVNAIIPPLALNGPCLTIRKFPSKALSSRSLIANGSMTERMHDLLEKLVRDRSNILISGGTGSGKTTLLNVLSAFVSPDERIVTVEDSAELQLQQPHVIRLESRSANMEGKGQVSLRDLVRNSLRMRPDRIIVGECRGGEALDMLQAMNTGHDGSMTTTHANSPLDALRRVETLVLFAELDLPSRAIREQIAAAVHYVLQQTRYPDGTRRVSSLHRVLGIDDNTYQFRTQCIFNYRKETESWEWTP